MPKKRICVITILLLVSTYFLVSCEAVPGNPDRSIVGVWMMGEFPNGIYYIFGDDEIDDEKNLEIQAYNDCHYFGTYMLGSIEMCITITDYDDQVCPPPEEGTNCTDIEWYNNNMIISTNDGVTMAVCKTENIGEDCIVEPPDLCLAGVAPDCGDYGECVAAEGIRTCECTAGYTGNICEIPPTP